MSLGIGAMLHMLSGSGENASTYYGRKIAAASMEDNRLQIDFECGLAIQIFDNGQLCCEHRYMRTDDDLATLVGRPLMRIESKEGTSAEDEWGGRHEVRFVEIGTDGGFVTISNHNEHNGYYGGFGLTIERADI